MAYSKKNRSSKNRSSRKKGGVKDRSSRTLLATRSSKRIKKQKGLTSVQRRVKKESREINAQLARAPSQEHIDAIVLANEPRAGDEAKDDEYTIDEKIDLLPSFKKQLEEERTTRSQKHSKVNRIQHIKNSLNKLYAKKLAHKSRVKGYEPISPEL